MENIIFKTIVLMRLLFNLCIYDYYLTTYLFIIIYSLIIY